MGLTAMPNSSILFDSSTNSNLIASLVQGRGQAPAWPEFLAKYRRLLIRWCLRWGATPTEAEDVVQETMLKMHTRLGTYRKVAGSAFRCWLKTVAYRCWLDVQETRIVRERSTDGLDAKMQLMTQEARDDLQQLFERLADEEILEMACLNLRRRVEPVSWQCFRMTYFEQVPGEKVAETLEMSLNAVYLTTSRLRKMLRGEIQAIESAC